MQDWPRYRAKIEYMFANVQTWDVILLFCGLVGGLGAIVLI